MLHIRTILIRQEKSQFFQQKIPKIFNFPTGERKMFFMFIVQIQSKLSQMS